MQHVIDLNSDVGESFGHWTLGQDAEILKHVSSANIACGFHAGDPTTMRATVRLALEQGVAIGAHPGLPDLVGFGRREMKVSTQEVQDLVAYQVGALDAIVRSEGGTLRHVKPHGALYNMAAKDLALATAIVEAVRRFNPELLIFGQSGSRLIDAAEALGIRSVCEVFADRTYEADGSLTPRIQPGSIITDVSQSLLQVIGLIQTGFVRTRQGTDVAVQADTLCIHGDGKHAADFAQQVHSALRKADIAVQAIR